MRCIAHHAVQSHPRRPEQPWGWSEGWQLELEVVALRGAWTGAEAYEGAGEDGEQDGGGERGED